MGRITAFKLVRNQSRFGRIWDKPPRADKCNVMVRHSKLAVFNCYTTTGGPAAECPGAVLTLSGQRSSNGNVLPFVVLAITGRVYIIGLQITSHLVFYPILLICSVILPVAGHCYIGSRHDELVVSDIDRLTIRGGDRPTIEGVGVVVNFDSRVGGTQCHSLIVVCFGVLRRVNVCFCRQTRPLIGDIIIFCCPLSGQGHISFRHGEGIASLSDFHTIRTDVPTSEIISFFGGICDHCDLAVREIHDIADRCLEPLISHCISGKACCGRSIQCGRQRCIGFFVLIGQSRLFSCFHAVGGIGVSAILPIFLACIGRIRLNGNGDYQLRTGNTGDLTLLVAGGGHCVLRICVVKSAYTKGFAGERNSYILCDIRSG